MHWFIAALRRGLLLALAVSFAALLVSISGEIQPAHTASPDIVIGRVSEGGNAGPSRADEFVESFDREETAVTRIREIQGAAHRSPRDGDAVSKVPGVVTLVRSNGFFMQDPEPDGDDATSEGIFVFTGSAPDAQVGDAVSVGGTAIEFRPGCNNCPPTASAFNNLTTTEITSPSIAVVSSGNATPTPVVIGTGGRLPPSAVIEDDVSDSVETGGDFEPAADGIDFYESLEGMLVRLDDPVAVGRRADFASSNTSELVVLAGDGANATMRTARGGIVVRPGDLNPERIFLSTPLGALPDVDVGSRLTSPIVGVIDYSFANFKLLAITSPITASGSLQLESTDAAGPDELAIATINVENLDANDPHSKFDALASRIVDNLKSPDILALEEVQDDSGPTNNGIVDASRTYAALIRAIREAGGPSYEVRQVDPVNNQDGGEEGGNIRVGLLFNPDRVAFVDRGDRTVNRSITGATVHDVGGTPRLSLSPGRIDPTNPAFNDIAPDPDWNGSRKSLAGEFLFNGQTIFVIANHFNSKGGDGRLYGRFQPPELRTEPQRLAQAQVVNDFVDQILAVDPTAKIVVLGDLNDFDFSTVLDTLEGGVLTNLMERLGPDERYTFIFDGNSQPLDHILVSDGLANVPFAYDIVHVNAELADGASDHDPQVARFTLAPATEVGR